MTTITRRSALAIGAAAVAVVLAPMLPAVAEAALLPLLPLDGRELQVVYPHMEDNDVAAVMSANTRPDGLLLLGINTWTVRDDEAARDVRRWAQCQLGRGEIVAFAFAYDDLDA